MKKSFIIIMAIILINVLPFQSIAFAKSHNDKPNQIKNVLVKFKDGKDGIEKKSKLNEVKRYKKLKTKNLYSVEISEESIKSLKEDKDIELIEEDSSVEKSDDKITWNINKVNSPEFIVKITMVME